MNEPISVYYAGVCGPENPGGHMAWAFVVYADEEIIDQQTGYVPPAVVNNEIHATYAALGNAMEAIFKARNQSRHIRFFGSTAMVVNQLNDIWDVDLQYSAFYTTIKNKLKKFRDVGFDLITNRRNKDTLDLARRELQSRGLISNRKTEAKP